MIKGWLIFVGCILIAIIATWYFKSMLYTGNKVIGFTLNKKIKET